MNVNNEKIEELVFDANFTLKSEGATRRINK